MKDCDECGEPTVRRRRCPHCDKLVCGYCYHHFHGQMSEMLSKARAAREEQSNAGGVHDQEER